MKKYVYYSNKIRKYEANNKIVLLHEATKKWVKMDDTSFAQLIQTPQRFKDILDKKFNFFNENNNTHIRGVYYSVTGRCNLNCEFCATKSGPNVSDKEDMSIEEIKKIVIPKLKLIKPRFIVISGGEPTIRKDIVEILKLFCNNFENNRIILQTNGLLFNEKMLSLIMPYIGVIEISIENIYDNELLYSQMIKNFEYLKKIGITMQFSFVIDKNSISKLKNAIDLCATYNAIFRPRVVSAVGRAIENITLLTEIEVINAYLLMAKYMLEQKLFSENLICNFGSGLQARESCSAYGKLLGINPNGTVYMCNNLQKDKYCLGNIKNCSSEQLINKLHNIMKSEEIKNLFLNERREECNNCNAQFFCSGMCVAELESNNFASNRNCNLKKAFVNYQMFYYQKNNTIEKNLQVFVDYFEQELFETF